jgi:signal transduction histidine kinase
VALIIGVGAIFFVLFLAQRQPWLGLKLGPAEIGATVLSAYGPSQAIAAGTVLVAVENEDMQLELTSLDLTTEPDGAMGDYATYDRFLERQQQLARIQSSPEIVFTAADGQRFVVEPRTGGRPLANLPVDFWVQCSVGLIAWLVSAAVFAFRPGEASARYLLLSGAATLLFAPAAAVYTTRELAVPGTLLRWASDLNFLGGSLFAASFVALLLVYPRRIAPTWVGPSVVALFVGWFAAQQVGFFESMTFARRFLVMVGVGVTFLLAAWHWHISDRNPLARAKLQWFLLSWVVGTSAFALFILLPQTFGVDTSPIQGYAFLLFLLVYGGLAMGILRYRLFELGEWWRRAIAWAAVVLLLILLDLFFIYGLQLSTETSLAASLLMCGLVWLPIRGWLWHRFTGRINSLDTTALFQKVMTVALASDAPLQAQSWRELMAAVFEPLEITENNRPAGNTVEIQNDGLSMDLPAVASLQGLQLSYAENGHRLFQHRDARLASELVYMLRHGLESLAAYGKGASEERRRIARDMHDNIGAQLLSALHSTDVTAKDAKIRESLADLRKVINETPDSPASIAETLADLRIETAERLEAVGLRLTWDTQGQDDVVISRTVGHALRSIIREAISNVIRHAEASQVSVIVSLEKGIIRIEVQDDGKGFEPSEKTEGNGLTNIRTRLDMLNAAFDLESHPTGSRLEARIPIQIMTRSI